MAVQLEGERADRGDAGGIDVGRVGGTGELERCLQAHRALVVDRDEQLAAFIGAAVVVGDAVEDLGGVGALVDVILERVAVTIGVGAAVPRRIRRGLALRVRAGVVPCR